MKVVALSTVLLAVLAAVPACVGGQVDPSGEWRTWKTEHFRVHAKVRLADHVEIAAREAERAYLALSRELDPPRGPIDLVINDAADFSNGVATVFPSNRITVNLARPGTSNSLGVYDNWLRLVITHELTHIFHDDRAGGVWRLLQRVFGRAPGLFPNTYQPGWVAEGIATYYESKLTSAGRLRGAYHEQIMSAAARDGHWPKPGDAVRRNRKWPAGTRLYAWGSRFFERQSALYGDSVVPRFVRRTSRQLIVFNVSSPMRDAGGESVAAGWKRLDVPASRQVNGYGLWERGLRAEPEPRLSADGTRICFRRSDGRSEEEVVIRDVRTGKDLRSHRVTSLNGLAWVGDTIYLTQLEYTSPVTVRSDLYRWEPDGAWERVTVGERHMELFALGDNRLGVTSFRSGKRVVGYLRNGDATVREIAVPTPASDWGRIALSPDGEWFAGARHANQRWDIVLWPAGRPDEQIMVTRDAAMDADPVWSDEGESILFSSERTGMPQIYSFNRKSRITRRMTDEPTGARSPAALGGGTLLFSTVLGDGIAMVQHAPRSFAAPDLAEAIEDSSMAPDREVRMQESPYSPWPGLRPHFWVPVIHDEGTSGTFLGALTLGADAIGQTRYSAFVAASPERGRVEGGLYIAHKRWRAWSVDAAAAQTWDFAPLRYQGSVVPVSFRERTAELGVEHAWRRWRTSAAMRLRGFLEQDLVVNEGIEPLPFVPTDPTFAGVAISVRAAHQSRPVLSISPEDGFAFDATLLRRWQTGGSGRWSYEARGSATAYLSLPLPGFSHWVVSANASVGVTGGPAATTFSVGGESGDLVEYLPGTAIGSGRRRFQMRGYAVQAGFTRAVVGIMELRVPVAMLATGLPGLPLFLDRISLNLFGEVGNGWNPGEAVELAALKDVGAESAVDLGLGAGYPLRMRTGFAVALANGLGVTNGSTRYYIAFGRSF